MWPCLWLCAVQLQTLMKTIWVHAVPVLGVIMALIAIWTLLLSGVRSSGLSWNPACGPWLLPVAAQNASQEHCDALMGFYLCS